MDLYAVPVSPTSFTDFPDQISIFVTDPPSSNVPSEPWMAELQTFLDSTNSTTTTTGASDPWLDDTGMVHSQVGTLDGSQSTMAASQPQMYQTAQGSYEFDAFSASPFISPVGITAPHAGYLNSHLDANGLVYSQARVPEALQGLSAASQPRVQQRTQGPPKLINASPFAVPRTIPSSNFRALDPQIDANSPAYSQVRAPEALQGVNAAGQFHNLKGVSGLEERQVENFMNILLLLAGQIEPQSEVQSQYTTSGPPTFLHATSPQHSAFPTPPFVTSAPHPQDSYPGGTTASSRYAHANTPTDIYAASQRTPFNASDFMPSQFFVHDSIIGPDFNLRYPRSAHVPSPSIPYFRPYEASINVAPNIAAYTNINTPAQLGPGSAVMAVPRAAYTTATTTTTTTTTETSHGSEGLPSRNMARAVEQAQQGQGYTGSRTQGLWPTEVRMEADGMIPRDHLDKTKEAALASEMSNRQVDEILRVWLEKKRREVMKTRASSSKASKGGKGDMLKIAVKNKARIDLSEKAKRALEVKTKKQIATQKKCASARVTRKDTDVPVHDDLTVLQWVD